MLESSKDNMKLEAMKRLVAMIAKGRSSDAAARELFPSVVKNVVTKNAELKKLVYLYLTRYAGNLLCTRGRLGGLVYVCVQLISFIIRLRVFQNKSKIWHCCRYRHSSAASKTQIR